MESIKLAVDILRLAEEIVGSTNPIIIDSNINKHDIFWDEEYNHTEAEINAHEALDIHTIKGSKNHPIKLFQVTDAFDAILKQFKTASEDRTYYYEGLVFDDSSNMYIIIWGS